MFVVLKVESQLKWLLAFSQGQLSKYLKRVFKTSAKPKLLSFNLEKIAREFPGAKMRRGSFKSASLLSIVAEWPLKMKISHNSIDFFGSVEKVREA